MSLCLCRGGGGGTGEKLVTFTELPLGLLFGFVCCCLMLRHPCTVVAGGVLGLGCFPHGGGNRCVF